MKIVGYLAAPVLLSMFIGIKEAGGQEGMNTASRMLQQEERLTIGGYGQIDYNQPIQNGTMKNGNLDVHRLVFMLGYKFSEKVQFVSEIELEHVKEVYVEQAFLQAEILPWLKFRGGLILIPMGIINEYHEPPTFNGVERPNLDKYIVPTTWREIGAGFTGTFPVPGLSYQAYLVNGFCSYDGVAKLDGPNGFRKGRQKGAESIISMPSLALRVNYFGIRGLQIGISLYGGDTQSTLMDEVDKSDPESLSTADSSRVGLVMIGADARYTIAGFSFRAQVNYGQVSGAGAYNSFTGSDLGSALAGGYAELSYNLFHSLGSTEADLIPFIRLERYNTHASVPGMTLKDPSLNRTDLTMGLGFKFHTGAMLKMDYQVFSDKAGADKKHQFNAGIAVWF
jgi:hypothetical protein